jgi:putative spermidine/putrescine transport system substrate-binding protein
MSKTSDPTLTRLLAEMAALPPHVADFRRRQLLSAAAHLGVGAAAVAAMTAPFAFPAVAAPAPKLPEITSVPEKLKGSGSVRVCSYGGAFQAAQREAYFKPFEKLCGVKVIESEGPDVAKVKAMVDTHTIEYDIGEFDRGDVINLQNKGNYWEQIDYNLFDTAHIAPAYRYTYAVDMLPYSEILAYRTDVFGSAKPSGWKDFWDTKQFPGPRTLTSGTGGLVPELEFAEIAAGTPVDKAYPINIKAAYASLAKIKPAIVKWWEAGAIPAQMLNDKEVVMGSAWNGRIAAIQATGAPVAISWNQGLLKRDCWAIAKGSPNLSNAQKFCAFITLPISQARLSMLIPYGFVNSLAINYIPAGRLQQLPTAPAIAKQLIIFDSAWWAANRDAVLAEWPAFLLR